MKRNSLIVTVRHNVDLETDIDLARDEAIALCRTSKGAVKDIKTKAELIALIDTFEPSHEAKTLLLRALRTEGTLAFHFSDVSLECAERVVRKGAFFQEVVHFSGKTFQANDALVARISRSIPGEFRAVTLASILDYSTRFVFHRAKGLRLNETLDYLLEFLLDETEPPKAYSTLIKSAILAKKTSLHLTHELHLYKGKFFPRMARSLINRFAPHDGSLIVDPFVGSGTALLEAALIGHDSLGIDVDPTSVLISANKLTPSDIDPDLMQHVGVEMREALNRDGSSPRLLSEYTISGWEKYYQRAPEPMRSRLVKRGSEEGYDLVGEVENDSAKANYLISQAPVEIQPLLRVCLSHALTKKLRLRFVGIGNGRFTIDVAKVGVLDLFIKKVFHLVAITEVFDWLKQHGLILANAEVVRGSAKDTKQILGKRKADLILTSPPYLPASSGREHYARARAIPLVFTGAATLEELDALDAAFIGEMSAQSDTLHLEEEMPQSVRKTLEFLRGNEQRAPKYIPTLNYYVDIEKVLTSSRDSLSESGKALFVVGKSHTFYVHKTKEILHSVDASTALADLGRKAGLKVHSVIDIPLKKSGGLNARPRSTDDYSESVIVFER